MIFMIIYFILLLFLPVIVYCLIIISTVLYVMNLYNEISNKYSVLYAY